MPATIIGFGLLYIFTQGAQVALYIWMGVQVQVHLHPFTVLLGLVTGLLIPMLSNIYPIKQALGTTLRDALDRFRSGVDDMEINFIRLENAGTNVT